MAAMEGKGRIMYKVNVLTVIFKFIRLERENNVN